jgi:Holliday junction DNA helicase RuvA
MARSGRDDILNALISLGYSASESQAALKKVPEDVEVAEGIRAALKLLSRVA